MPQSDYDAEELEKVKELRDRLKDILDPDMYNDTHLFIRFLRARNRNMVASENMLRNHINWRKFNDVENIFSWYSPHEVSQKYIPVGNMAFDKEGAPVVYVDLGKVDTRGILKSIKVQELLNYCIEFLEKLTIILKKQSAKSKSGIEQWVFILNFEDFSLATATHRPTIEAFTKLVTMYESNHPERLKAAYVINASWYFHIGFALVKPFISGPTFQKIKIFGKDGWRDELLKSIDAENLPAFLGGKLTDPNGDPRCATIVKHGAKIPERHYSMNNKTNFTSQGDVRKLEINRLSKVQIELLVLYPNSDIEWEFESKGKDIAFGLLFKENETSHHEGKEVVPKQRVDTSIASESGVFKCERPGKYFMEFDNTYSWIYRKEVYYRVQVKRPKELSESM